CDCPYDISELESIDRQRLFYNRVPKCGSTTLITLIRKLAVKNNYIHFNSKIYDKKNVDEEEQAHTGGETLVKKLPKVTFLYDFFIVSTNLSSKDSADSPCDIEPFTLVRFNQIPGVNSIYRV
ncbi:hypothetical protein AVEN_60479-1, partial [Araneus ventricosus]